MRSLKRVAWLTAGVILLSVLPGLETKLRGQNQILVWAPQPLQPGPWSPPNKAITRLAELGAKHEGEQNWTETIVDDNLFRWQDSEAFSSGQSRLVGR
jgi:hypothetical protein